MDDSDSVFGCVRYMDGRNTNLKRWLHTMVNDILSQTLHNPALVPGQMAICPGIELLRGSRWSVFRSFLLYFSSGQTAIVSI
jgi:hypothetical protein